MKLYLIRLKIKLFELFIKFIEKESLISILKRKMISQVSEMRKLEFDTWLTNRVKGYNCISENDHTLYPRIGDDVYVNDLFKVAIMKENDEKKRLEMLKKNLKKTKTKKGKK